MRSRVRRLAIPVVMACLLAGCQPAVLPTPSPAPSYRCTPEAGGDEFDCTQHQYDDMVAKDKLYAEAEAVYRRYFAENDRVYRAGGITEPTPVLLETTTGDYLADAMKTYRSMKKSGQKIVGGEIQLAWLRRSPGESLKGSIVSLETCVDMSSTKIVKHGRVDGSGIVGIEQVFFGRIDGSLKIQNSAWEELDSC